MQAEYHLQNEHSLNTVLLIYLYQIPIFNQHRLQYN